MLKLKALGVLISLGAALGGRGAIAPTNGVPEEFSAVAIRNDNLGAGADRVIMRVSRWSTEAERGTLTRTLLKDGPDQLLEVLQQQKSVGNIRTPDSLGYDLRYSYQEPREDGGRRVVLATDRPISFWEAKNRPRTIDYPFTVIQMELDNNGEGRGTLSIATKIQQRGNAIELENFSSSPVMLTKVEAKPIK